MNVSDLRKVLGMPELSVDDDTINNSESTSDGERSTATTNASSTRDTSSRLFRVRRQSMEQLDLIKVFFCLF